MTTKTQNQSAVVATFDGDFVGHPFRGNQHLTADEHSKSAMHSSMRAKHAEKHGDEAAKKSSHKRAHHAHMAAAEGATGKTKIYHETMAKFHGGRAGVTALDATHGENLYGDGTGKWHSQTMAVFAKKTDAQLEFIIKDARDAAKAAQSLGNAKKEGEYTDEMHYASMELRKRRDAQSGRKKLTLNLDGIGGVSGDIGQDQSEEFDDGEGLFDSVALDATEYTQSYGVISLNGEVIGWADIGGDGKSTIYVGDESSNVRLQTQYGKAMYTDDGSSLQSYVKELYDSFKGKDAAQQPQAATIAPMPVAPAEDLTTAEGIRLAIANRIAIDRMVRQLDPDGSVMSQLTPEQKAPRIEHIKSSAVAEMNSALTSDSFADIAQAIIAKDPQPLISKFVYSSFETAESVFKDATGVKVKGLNREKKTDALLKWSGMTQEQADKWKSDQLAAALARTDARAEAGKLKAVQDLWKYDLENQRFNVNGSPMKANDYILSKVQEGYTTVKAYKMGATIGYSIANAEGNGPATGKIALLNKFYKAVKQYNGGDMIAALTALGVDVKTTAPDPDPVEPGITEEDNKAAAALFQTPAQREAAAASSNNHDVKSNLATIVKDIGNAPTRPSGKYFKITTANDPYGVAAPFGEKAGLTADPVWFETSSAAAKWASENGYSVDKKPLTMLEVAPALAYLKDFIGKSQMAAIKSGMTGEEGDYFKEKMVSLADQIKAMPKTYDQDGKGMDAIAHLHYFRGSMDFYITEKDMETEQLQAFGWADLGHGGELGYINIAELVSSGVEIDLHWTPKTLNEALGKVEKSELDPAAPAKEDALSDYDADLKKAFEFGFDAFKSGRGNAPDKDEQFKMLKRDYPGTRSASLLREFAQEFAKGFEAAKASEKSTQANPQRDADMDYLQAVIDNTVPDILAQEVGDRLESIINMYSDDVEVTNLVEAAADAYSQAMLKTV